MKYRLIIESDKMVMVSDYDTNEGSDKINAPHPSKLKGEKIDLSYGMNTQCVISIILIPKFHLSYL